MEADAGGTVRRSALRAVGPDLCPRGARQGETMLRKDWPPGRCRLAGLLHATAGTKAKRQGEDEAPEK